MAKFASHMGDPHGDPQTSPQHADQHGLGAFLKKTMQEIHVDRRVACWSAGHHLDHPCVWEISLWSAYAKCINIVVSASLIDREERTGRGPPNLRR